MEAQKDHTHDLYVSGSGDKAVYTLGPPKGQLQARVPIYGKLAFLDKTGSEKEKGINVGDEWTYRSFIEGRTAAAAIWTFDGLSEDLFPESKFPNGIPVEMTIEVFRTYKGNQEKGVAGTITPASIRRPGKQVIAAEFPRQEIRHRRADHSPQLHHRGQRRQSGDDRSVRRPGPAKETRPTSSATTAAWKSACNAWNRSSTTAWPRPTCTSAPPTVGSPGTSSRATWGSGCKWPWSSAWA